MDLLKLELTPSSIARCRDLEDIESYSCILSIDPMYGCLKLEIPVDTGYQKEIGLTAHREPEAHIGKAADMVLSAMNMHGESSLYKRIYGLTDKDDSVARELCARLELERYTILHKSKSTFDAIEDFCKGDKKIGEKSIVVARHIVEHCPDIKIFLEKLRDSIEGDTICILEVPDCSLLYGEMDISQIWEEHRYYLTTNTMRDILANNGFDLIEMGEIRSEGEDILIAIAKRGEPTQIKEVLSQSSDKGNLLKQIDSKIREAKNLIRQYSHTHRIYLVGANHKAGNFIDILGKDAIHIDFIIDDDVNKIGKTLGKAKVPISASGEIAHGRPVLLIIALDKGRYPDVYKRFQRQMDCYDGHSMVSLVELYKNTDTIRAMSTKYTKRSCPICGTEEQFITFELAATPLGDRFCETRESAKALETYPLRVVECANCMHLYIPLLTDVDESYKHYLFESSSSPGLVDLFKEIIGDMCLRNSIGSGSLILDIGANDGSWLEVFKLAGYEVTGIEPAPGPAKIARKKGIKIIEDYFSKELLNKQDVSLGKPKLITMNYMFANLPDPNGMLGLVSELANEDTVISILTGYHPAQLSVSMFDYIYHEHLQYYSCKDIHNLAKQNDLTITYCREVPLKGGSIHVEMMKTSSGKSTSELFRTMLKREEWLNSPKNIQWDTMATSLEKTKNAITKTVQGYKESGKEIVGYGTSHSTTTLTYALGLQDMIDILIDDNTAKHGCYSPGNGVKVCRPVDILLAEGTKAVVVLAWQHQGKIIEAIRNLGFKGKVIIPFPEFKVIEL